MNAPRLWTGERILLQGLMPERALLRLRRAGVAVYRAKKIAENQIVFCVTRKDSEKVFAIYPDVCYNGSGYAPYAVRRMGAVGFGKCLAAARKRAGLLFGGLLALAILLISDGYVFALEFRGTSVYAREVRAALRENGVRLFAPYRTGKEDAVAAQLLRIADVEYASVRKEGYRLVVELRTSPFAKPRRQTGDMTARRDGKVLSAVVLRGAAKKQVGDDVRAGETLVAAELSSQDGRTVATEVVARVRLGCSFVGEIEAADEEEAFAAAYLALGLAEAEKIERRTVSPVGENAYRVEIEYTVLERMNF